MAMLMLMLIVEFLIGSIPPLDDSNPDHHQRAAETRTEEERHETRSIDRGNEPGRDAQHHAQERVRDSDHEMVAHHEAVPMHHSRPQPLRSTRRSLSLQQLSCFTITTHPISQEHLIFLSILIQNGRSDSIEVWSDVYQRLVSWVGWLFGCVVVVSFFFSFFSFFSSLSVLSYRRAGQEKKEEEESLLCFF